MAELRGVPPAVRLDLASASLLDHWRARARQHTSDSYVGLPLAKFPEDLRAYEHLLSLDVPDTVVEVGTQYGGSALWFRDRLRTLAGYGRLGRDPLVVSVDIDQSLARAALSQADPDHGATIVLIEGDITDPAIPTRVREIVGDDRRCLVVEDGAHEYETTRAALEGLAGLVAPGGFLVVEDGCVDVELMRISDAWPRGVLPALHDWLATPAGSEFVPRPDLELYGISCHPEGYLQRRPLQGAS